MNSKVRPYKIKYFSRHCPVCDHALFESLDIFLSSGFVYYVMICNFCGHVYQNPIYSKEHYHLLQCSYPDDYWKHSIKRANYIIDMCAPYISHNQNMNILDIGAGRGGVLMSIYSSVYQSQIKRCDGITLEKMNVNDRFIKLLLAFPGLENTFNLYNFDFESENLIEHTNEDIKYDFIIMSHVLEHFINPKLVLNKIKDLLKPDGIVYIEVPSLYNAEYRIKSVWRPEHLSYYTKTSLETLMTMEGFVSETLLDSKIWGNIKGVYSYNPVRSAKHIFICEQPYNVKRYYNRNTFKKRMQRLKHRVNIKYEANI